MPLRALGLAWLLALAALAFDARAQAVLTAQAERVELWPHVKVLDDPSKKMTLADALAARNRLGPPAGAYATLGMGTEVTWILVPLMVSGGGGAWILDIDYALLNSADVYLVRDGQTIQQAKLGSAHPFSMRPLRGRSHAMPLEFTVGGPAELWLRVDTPGAKLLPMTLDRRAAFHERAIDEQMLQGALAALGLVLVLYSLAQWAHLREPLYAKYALLTFCSAMFSVHFFGIGEMYLWTDIEWFGRHMAGITALMAAAATALFVEDVLAGDLHRALRYGLRGIAVLHTFAAFAHGIDLLPIKGVAVMMNTTGLAPSLMGVPGAIARWRRGDSVGAWFIAAWVGYFVASYIMVGVVRGTIGANFWTLHSFQIGATLDMLIFMRIAILRTARKHRDVERVARERDTLHSLAHSDPLTGLLNRRAFDDALIGALERANPQRILALYVLDLDGFKPVNDKYGHAAGDQLLRVVAQRLRGSMRSGDAVARIGGDEFVVLAELSHEAQARELGLKILDAFRSPFVFSEHAVTVSATVGYALAPTDTRSAPDLFKAADAAMYVGKSGGKDRLVRAGE